MDPKFKEGGWVANTVQEFLDLTDDEDTFIECQDALATSMSSTSPSWVPENRSFSHA